jgi:hypothetical protein
MRSAWNRRWGGYLLAAFLVASIAASCGPDADVRTESGDAPMTVDAPSAVGVSTSTGRSM